MTDTISGNTSSTATLIPAPVISIASTSTDRAEGDTGDTAYTFTVTRTGEITGSSSVTYTVTGIGVNPANSDDFGGTLAHGRIDFAANETSKSLTIQVSGDTTIEDDERFAVTLTTPRNATLGVSVGIGTIRSDDLPNSAPSFVLGDGGPLDTTLIGSGSDSPTDFAIQIDGKFLVVGINQVGNYRSFVAERFNSDGSIDTSFGSDGKSVVDFGTGSAFGISVEIQLDGKILIAGTSNGDFALARLKPDGSLDSSFNNTGLVSTDFHATNDIAREVTLLNDGKIIAVGQREYRWDTSDFAIARYNPDGSLDTTFDGDGLQTTNFAGWANSLAVQADGKLVLAGYGPGFDLARYNIDGSLDDEFGSAGRVTTSFGDVRLASADIVAIQDDGKIVAAGVIINIDTAFALVRYNSDGSLDSSFDDDGKVTTDLQRRSYSVSDMVIQKDGKVLVAGFDFSYGIPKETVITRYNLDGSLDATFGIDGKVVTAGINDPSIALQSDGKIVVAGAGSSGIAFVRYNPDGTFDLSFDTVKADTLGGTQTYVEDGFPAALDTSVHVVDEELAMSGDYSGASITLARHGGANTEDIFSASGNLAPLAQGDSVTLAGSVIGTVTTNSDGTLTITFNGNATQARVDETLSSIAYANSNDVPPASVQIDWIFSDGNQGPQGTGGALAATGSTIVNITPANDGAILTGFETTPTYTENGAAVALAPGAHVFDPELFALDNYAGASVAVARQNGANPDDYFSGSGNLGELTQGSNLMLSGIVIGTVDRNSFGSLKLIFNGNATQARIDEALSSIAYFNSNNVPPDSVQIDWTFNDGNNGNQGVGESLTANSSNTVTITPSNDAPQLPGIDATPTFSRENAAVVLNSRMEVIDVELAVSGSYGGASVTLARQDSANGDDHFSASGNLGALTQGSSLELNGLVIGEVTTNSNGLLNITFNNSATQYLVTETLRSIAYSNTGTTPPSPLQISWTFSDGNVEAQGIGGAKSATGTMTINVKSNDAPVIVNVSIPSIFHVLGPLVTVDSMISITDDSSNLAGATVSIGTGFTAGDVLGFTNRNNISGSYNSWTGVLTLTGSDTVANYQNALRSVTFFNPMLTSNTSRTINWLVDDGKTINPIGTATSSVILSERLSNGASLNVSGAADLTNGVPLAITHLGQEITGTFGPIQIELVVPGGSATYYGSFAYVGDAIDASSSMSSYKYSANGMDLTLQLGYSINVVSYFGMAGSGLAFTQAVLSRNDNITGTGSGSQHLFGYDGDDLIRSGSGNDVLVGGNGNDVLHGGTGADNTSGNAGNDFYHIDNVGDVVTESPDEGTDTVVSSIALTLGANVENLILAGSSALNGTGNTLDNNITGNSGNNTLNGGAGNDSIDGGTGTDTAQYLQHQAAYRIGTESNGRSVDGPEGADTLTNIERLHFDDANLAFDTEGNAGQVYRLYKAAFARSPDLAGLGSWIKAMDEGQTLEQVAATFAASTEFQNLYGTGTSNADFVKLLYLNALGRAPDSGLNDWVRELDLGAQSRAQVLAGFSESPENKSAVQDRIEDGIAYATPEQATLVTQGLSLTGTSGADSLYGSVAKDTLSGLAGDDSLNGGAGVDTSVYGEARSAYTITRTSSGLTTSGGTEGSDSLTHVERLKFSDQVLAFDVDGNAGQVYRLYQAAFARTPDVAGLSDWVRGMDGGMTLRSVATGFIGSAEFQGMYGASPSDDGFVNLLYQNVLHRAPDDGGKAYWMNELDRGMSRDMALIGFSESNENQVAIIGVIQDGIQLLPG